MRLVGAAIALALALSPTTSSAQAPPASSWRSAAKAALAFGHAEGNFAALRHFTLTTVPQSKRVANALLDEFDQRAQRARDAYASVARHGSPFWTAAAELRIGDTLVCQAEKLRAFPPPREIAAALPPGRLAEYLEVFDGLVKPLHDQAARHWERAAGDDMPDFVAGRARQRLAGVTVPDC